MNLKRKAPVDRSTQLYATLRSQGVPPQVSAPEAYALSNGAVGSLDNCTLRINLTRVVDALMRQA